MDELISRFSLDHCSKSGAKFAFEKGKWFNHEYLQKIPDAELAGLFKPVLSAHGVNPADFSDEYIAKSVGLVKSRINFVNDLWDNAKFFFVAPTEYEAKSVKKRWSAEMPAIMTALAALLEAQPDFTGSVIEPVVMQWIADNGYHLGNVMNAFRLTVVGECKGPHMFDITDVLGKAETLDRIRAGVERIRPVE